jgi:hypothetical protein
VKLLSCCALAALAGLAAACGAGVSSSYPTAGALSVRVPPQRPPSPTTWSHYPHFPQQLCWESPFLKGEVRAVRRLAPSDAFSPHRHRISPETVAHRLLARFGDQRYIRSIRFSPAPPAVGRRVHVLYAGGHPPRDSLVAKIVVRSRRPLLSRHPSPKQSLTNAVISWEATLVGGALRDDLCSTGTAPLVAWHGAGAAGLSERVFALDQRFPNPSRAAFRRRVSLIGRRYGFHVVSMRLLQPRQIAPLLIVGTSRPRKAFVHDIPAIMNLLDPTSSANDQTANTFEGLFFAVENTDGPFAEVQYALRGSGESGEWSSDPCDYPYMVVGPRQKCRASG